MQIPQSIHAGDVVEIRRRRWRVVDVQTYERCRALAVVGIGPSLANTERRFLVPFDTAAAIGRLRTPRFVRPRRWRHACRGLLAAMVPPGCLRAAAAARIDLLPHQLEPALALVRGCGSRILLADAVGLGKTIQAGLIVAELRARGQADRVLIATPSGLRDQWRDELADRFGIDAAVVDFREIRRRARAAPAGLNPWITTPTAIVSTDYLKRREVLQSIRACRWDVFVVDEAHAAGLESDRLSAVSALASGAAVVVLLTATPHSGDPRAFEALCGIGALDDALLVFRRTKASVDAGLGRRVHQLLVRSSAAESRMHARLAEFTRAVRSEHDFGAAGLALSVLHKRAYSSARSLELTVGRRLDALGTEVEDDAGQLALPLDDEAGELDEADDAPDCLAAVGLADARRERRLLEAVRDAARLAAAKETKVLALQRLLRRVAEPIVLFTEYRDTLLHLRSALGEPALVLHGGLTRDEQRVVLEQFLNGACRILLATDAAGEGLNLQRRCRLVVNLELPWNPMRLEQRIGRVDRIGQLRRVHAMHLVAVDTGEARVLDRLKARIARARQDVDTANPIEDEERANARSAIENDQAHPDSPAVSTVAAADPAASARQTTAQWLTLDLRREASHEAARLEWARRLSDEEGMAALANLEATGPWVVRARLRTSRRRLGRRITAILRIDDEDGTGRLAGWTVVAVSLELAGSGVIAHGQLRAWLSRLEMDLRAPAEEARRAPPSVSDRIEDFLSARLAREKRMAKAADVGVPAPFQPGLFDRRAEHVHLIEKRLASESATEISSRIRILERSRCISRRPARLLLVLVP